MRMSYRISALMLLAAVWPQLGCLQLPNIGAAQPAPPIRSTQQNLGAAPTPPAPSPAEIAQSLLNQADALEKAGRPADAIGAYERVRQCGGDFALYATKRLAILHDLTGNVDRAGQEYDLLLAYNQQHKIRDAELLYHAGDFYFRRGQTHTAEKHLTNADAYQSNHPQTMFKLGLVLAYNGGDRGDHQETLNYLHKALGSKSEAYCQFASVMNSLGKREDAARAYQAALGEEPNMPRARAELAKMNVAPTPISGAVFVRHTTPLKTDLHGSAEMEDPGLAPQVADGMNRLMSRHPTLPALLDLDLTASSGRDWETSAKKK